MRLSRFPIPVLCGVLVLTAAAPLRADWFVFGPSNGGWVMLGRFPEPGPDVATVCDGSGDCQSGSGEEFCSSCHGRQASTTSGDLATRHTRTFFPRIEVPLAGERGFAGGTLVRKSGATLWRSQLPNAGAYSFPAGSRLVRTRSGRVVVVYEGSAPPALVR